MCLVNDDCETLIFQSLHAVNDVRKLLNGGSDNFKIAWGKLIEKLNETDFKPK